jgi:hypothetical protein
MLGTGRASPGGQRPRPRPPTSSMSILIQQQRVPNKSVPWGFRRATWPRGRRKGAVGFGRVGAWRVVVKRLEAREREPSGIKHSASWDGRCHPPPRPRAVRCGLTSGVPNGASRQHRKTDPHMETVWSSPRNVAGWPQRTQSSPGGSGPDSDRTTARQHDSTTARQQRQHRCVRVPPRSQSLKLVLATRRPRRLFACITGLDWCKWHRLLSEHVAGRSISPVQHLRFLHPSCMSVKQRCLHWATLHTTPQNMTTKWHCSR